MRIDAHQHFWQYSVEEYGWIGQQMAVLQQNYLPADLVPQLEGTGLDGTVTVQARQRLEETEWLLSLSDQYPSIRGVVGWVDLCGPDVQMQLEHFSTHEKFCGVRHVVQDEPDDQFMLREDFLRGLAALRAYGLTYDILIFPRHLPTACQVAAQFSDQPFVLDHIAKPLIKEQVMDPWAEGIQRLAAFPNVYCKASGLVSEADWQRWQPADFRPYLDIVFEAFGPERIMFGSDWPVCTVVGTYAEVADALYDYVKSFSEHEQAAVWGETAWKFYRLG